MKMTDGQRAQTIFSVTHPLLLTYYWLAPGLPALATRTHTHRFTLTLTTNPRLPSDVLADWRGGKWPDAALTDKLTDTRTARTTNYDMLLLHSTSNRQATCQVLNHELETNTCRPLRDADRRPELIIIIILLLQGLLQTRIDA